MHGGVAHVGPAAQQPRSVMGGRDKEAHDADNSVGQRRHHQEEEEDDATVIRGCRPRHLWSC